MSTGTAFGARSLRASEESSQLPNYGTPRAHPHRGVGRHRQPTPSQAGQRQPQPQLPTRSAATDAVRRHRQPLACSGAGTRRCRYALVQTGFSRPHPAVQTSCDRGTRRRAAGTHMHVMRRRELMRGLECTRVRPAWGQAGAGGGRQEPLAREVLWAGSVGRNVKAHPRGGGL